MFIYLENDMGFENGLNYFPMPYDWRQAEGSKELFTNFKRTLEWSLLLNHKKMIIVAHSLGGVNSNIILNILGQEFNDKHIERLVTVGTPYSGAP